MPRIPGQEKGGGGGGGGAKRINFMDSGRGASFLRGSSGYLTSAFFAFAPSLPSHVSSSAAPK